MRDIYFRTFCSTCGEYTVHVNNDCIHHPSPVYDSVEKVKHILNVIDNNDYLRDYRQRFEEVNHA
jgi:hypothetical protein